MSLLVERPSEIMFGNGLPGRLATNTARPWYRAAAPPLLEAPSRVMRTTPLPLGVEASASPPPEAPPLAMTSAGPPQDLTKASAVPSVFARARRAGTE